MAFRCAIDDGPIAPRVEALLAREGPLTFNVICKVLRFSNMKRGVLVKVMVGLRRQGSVKQIGDVWSLVQRELVEETKPENWDNAPVFQVRFLSTSALVVGWYPSSPKILRSRWIHDLARPAEVEAAKRRVAQMLATLPVKLPAVEGKKPRSAKR